MKCFRDLQLFIIIILILLYFNNLLSRAGVSLAAIKMVIIDEVDTMLQKGFQQQVRSMKAMGKLVLSHA